MVFQAEHTATNNCMSFITNSDANNGIYDERTKWWHLLWNNPTGTGLVRGGPKASMRTDGEGGNIELVSPDSSMGAEMDLCDNKRFRIYMYTTEPWTWLASFEYLRDEKLFHCTDADFDAPNLREGGTFLSDKYVQQCLPEYDAFYTAPNTPANTYRTWRILQITDQIASKCICIVCLTFLNVPAGGTIKYFIGVGSLDCTYLYSNYNASGYKARLKGTATNDSSVSNNVSVCHAIYVADATVRTDWIKVEFAPSYAYGSGTNYNPVMAAITKC